MARYINVEDVEHLILENLNDLSELMKTAKGTDREKLFFKEMGLTDALAHLSEVPTADVQVFFTEDEIALINEYKDEVKAVDFKAAILSAVSVASLIVSVENCIEICDDFA